MVAKGFDMSVLIRIISPNFKSWESSGMIRVDRSGWDAVHVPHSALQYIDDNPQYVSVIFSEAGNSDPVAGQAKYSWVCALPLLQFSFGSAFISGIQKDGGLDRFEFLTTTQLSLRKQEYNT